MSAILLVFLLGGSALAESWTGIPSRNFPLHPPPVEGSKEDRADLEKLLAYQRGERQGECALANAQPHPDFAAFFKDSGILSEEEIARTKPVLDKVIKLSVRVASYHKGKFLRPRPYQRDRRIKPCADMPTGRKSYPSSHATAAFTASCVLAFAYTPRAKELIEYGQMLARLREVVGVHHPSDVGAGIALGTSICVELLRREDFKSEMRAVY